MRLSNAATLLVTCMPAEEQLCSKCGRSCRAEDVLAVDGRAVCRRCLHGDIRPVCMYPIGYVRREGGGGDGRRDDREEVVAIELLPTMAPFLEGLSDEQRLTIVWVFDRSCGVRTRFRRGLDGKEVGIFASRSPHRINPIAITEVELVAVEGTTLRVRGLDAWDGSPVLDIKLALPPRGR